MVFNCQVTVALKSQLAESGYADGFLSPSFIAELPNPSFAPIEHLGFWKLLFQPTAYLEAKALRAKVNYWYLYPSHLKVID